MPKLEIEIPDDLKGIETSVKDWLEYKREKGQGYKPKGLKYLWARLRDIPEDKRKPAIEWSMACNYAGIFEPKGAANDREDTESTYIPGKYGK